LPLPVIAHQQVLAASARGIGVALNRRRTRETEILEALEETGMKPEVTSQI